MQFILQSGGSSRLQRQHFFCVFHAIVVLGDTVAPGRFSPRGRAARAGARGITAWGRESTETAGKFETLKSSRREDSITLSRLNSEV